MADVAVLGKRNRAVLDILGELGGWHSLGEIRIEAAKRGLVLTGDQASSALMALLGGVPLTEPPLVVRREVEEADHARLGTYRREHGIKTSYPQWLYRRVSAA